VRDIGVWVDVAVWVGDGEGGAGVELGAVIGMPLQAERTRPVANTSHKPAFCLMMILLLIWRFLAVAVNIKAIGL